MERSVYIVDVRQHLSEGIYPELLLENTGAMKWIVRSAPVGETEEKGCWSTTKSGPIVRVPIFPYQSKSCNMEDVVLSAMNIAQQLLLTCPESITSIGLIIGKPVEDLRPTVDAFRLWVGFVAKAARR